MKCAINMNPIIKKNTRTGEKMPHTGHIAVVSDNIHTAPAPVSIGIILGQCTSHIQ